MNRKREQAALIWKIGSLFGPLVRMSENPSSYDADERERIAARFHAELPAFSNLFSAYCSGEPGHSYSYQQRQSANIFHSTIQMSATVLAQSANNFSNQYLDLVQSIPVPIDSAVYEARTPFTTYCLVKDLCCAVNKKLVWFDRYFDHTIFHRYLVETSQSAQITLVTWPRSECKGKRDESRFDDFMDISKLFAQQRGPQSYCLIVNKDFHDRWLRCDDKFLVLGGSIKDIGKDNTFTVSRLDTSPQTLKEFDEPVINGVELFGPRQPVHQ
jgi:hypothetical protein